MTAKISQKDYLKKYLSSDDKLKKKKKKSKDKLAKSTVKIIDDDEYAYNNQDNMLDDSDLYALNEEAPQVVGVIDERAPDVLMKQEYIDSGKWKKIGASSKSDSKKEKKQKRRSLSEDPSPPRRQNSPKRDESPPRRKRRSSDESPPRRRNNSPPRDVSNKRRDSDASPPRRSRRDSDASPPRKSRRDSDESPPRRSKKDASPPRKSRRDSDASPPRRSRRDSDALPPRRPGKSSEPLQRRRNSDESPPRRNRKSPETSRRRKDSSDASPPRRSRISPKKERRDSGDNSPPRRSRKKSNSPRQRRSRWSPEVKREPESPKRHKDSPPRSSRMTKTLDGKASGLQDAKTLKRENDEFKDRQEKLFREMRPELSGRDADLVIRDRKGRNKEFEKEVENERKKSAAEEARKKVYDRWGKGVKQVEDLEKRFQEHVYEASKPLARSADDADLRDHLRNQERIDDPMLEYMRKKKRDENTKKGVTEKPKYLGQFADNRFNIRPGYRWDGVDRSNGYEKKYFSMINSKKSMEEEAYRYSTEDM